MIHFNKLRIPPVLKWVPLIMTGRYYRASKTSNLATGSCYNFRTLRFYGRKRSCQGENDPKSCGVLSKDSANAAQRKAQDALREYLYSTRGLLFLDAEYISHNSPRFLENLLKKVEGDAEIGQSISRLLHYHPINEFEPFFESMGLEPSEYSLLLPRNLMYLNDDAVLLENYNFLCNYGIARSNIGRIYKEANKAFRYDYGVLQSKLQAFEELGLGQSCVVKLVSSNPSVLIGDRNVEFFKVLENLKRIGIDYVWLEEHLIDVDSYSWRHILELIRFLSNMAGNEEQLRKMICPNLGLLFADSGNICFSLVGFMFKFGTTKNEICSMFSLLPKVNIKSFACNLRRCYRFLVEIDMEVREIGRIVHSEPLMLGSCSLKKLRSLQENLKTGKKRLSATVKSNPHILKDWVIGLKVKPLPNPKDEHFSFIAKTKFLLDLGFIENSNELEKALKVIRGKGEELQERFDCFVKAGLNRKDVLDMIKVAPRVLNQTKDIIDMKIDFLLNGLGYPLSALVAFPAYVNFNIERVKLRFSMYDWLKNKGRVKPNLALSTILACSDTMFIKQYVNEHSGGPEFWQKLRKQINRD